MSSFRIDSTIVITTKHKVISLRLPLLMLLAAVGSVCTFAVCISMIKPDYHPFAFWSTTIVTILAGCVFNVLPQKLNLSGFLPPAAGLLIAFIKREDVILGAKMFYNSYYSEAHNTETQYFLLDTILSEEAAVTWFMCCVSIIVCSFISIFLIRKTYFILYFILTFAPAELGLYEGLPMNMPAMLILVATWFGVLAIQLAGQRGQNPGSHRVRSGNIANCGVAALAVTTAAVLVSVMIASHYSLTTDENIQSKRHELRKDIEEFRWDDILDSFEKLGITLGIFEDPDTRELGTKNSLEYKDRDEVQVTFTELPDSGVYLKGFTGSVYENNKWSVLPDEVWEENERLDTLFNKFECVPQILPFMNSQAYASGSNAVIEIEPLIKSPAILMPYAAYGEGFTYEYDTGCYIQANDSYEFVLSLDQSFTDAAYMPLGNYYLPSSGFNFSDATTATFFEQLGVDASSDMFCISSVQPPYIDNAEYTTQALQAALTESYVYRPFVYETYTEIADSEALAEVYASIPSEIVSMSEIGNDIDTLGAIRTYLANQCEYSLSPGQTPPTRDFVNYFLLENNKGYCMHYATAGTVIARYLGIPARYCEGYIVSRDMMDEGEENSDGSITVTLQDAASHAWCEFYVDGYGWIPYELTPGYYDTEAGPSTDSQTTTTSEAPSETETQTETQTEAAVTTTATTADYSNNDSASVTTTAGTGINSTQSDGGSIPASLIKAIAIVIAALLIIGLLLGSVFALRNYCINRRMRQFRSSDRTAGIISIYGFLMKLLKLMELTPENRQLLDFASLVRQQLDNMGYDGEGAEMLIELALAADMGGKTPSADEINACIRYVNNLAASYGSSFTGYKRLIMRYVYHLF